MRQFTLWCCVLATCATLSCSGQSADPLAEAIPDPSAMPAASGLGVAVQQPGVVQSALGLYTVTLDHATLSGSIELRATRASQLNSDVYALAIDNFLRADSLKIASIEGTATTVEVGYVLAHPFPAPSDPTGTPNGSTNRSDLAISGMVLALTDVASASGNTYFTDRVANTEMVVNADGYFAPASLISWSGSTNTFPYRLIVDESGPDGSRLGVSNGGDPTGNYGTDGWTRSEYGPANDGWTGYGVLHQGQASRNTLSLDRATLATTGFSFDVAVIAVYNDPRGGATAVQKRANRLPPASPDHTRFAYRMPHGALDVQRVVFQGEGGGFIVNEISASELRFHVEDWDARAAETSEAVLADDPIVTNVAQGESGLPALAVCIPGVTGDATSSIDLVAGPVDDDSAYGGDAAPDAGLPGDALFFSELVTKFTVAGQTAGTYTGLVRVADATAAAPLWIPLDEGTPPLPLTSGLPVPVHYQAFEVELEAINTDPTGNWSIVSNPIYNGGTTTINVTNVVDPDSATFDIQVDWGNGGGWMTVATGLTPGAGPFNSGASPVYSLTNPSIGETRTLACRLVDGVSGNTPLATNVGGSTLNIDPLPPGFAGWAYKPLVTGSGPDYTYHIAVDNTGAAYITGWFNSGQVDFGGGLRTNIGGGTTYYICKLSNTGTWVWDKVINTQTCGTSQNFANTGGIAVDSANNIYVTGNYQGCLDLGGPTLTNNQSLVVNNDDLYVVKFDSSGNWLWQVSSTGNGLVNSNFSNDDSIDVNAAGEVVACFDFGNTETLGAFTFTATGGAASANRDPAGVRLDANGNVLWAGRLATAPSTSVESARTTVIDDAGNMYFGGQIANGADFGGGAITTVGTYDGYIVKLSPTGTYIWHKVFAGSASDDVWGLARDSSRLYATGQFYTGADFGSGPRSSVGTGSDAFVAAWTHAGTPVWDQIFTSNSASADYGVGIEANGGAVIATGFFFLTGDFGTAGTIASNGGSDIWVASFNPATGAIDWVDRFGSTGTDDGRDVAVDFNGDPYLGVRWVGTVDFDPGAGVTNLTTNASFTDPMGSHWRRSTNSF